MIVTDEMLKRLIQKKIKEKYELSEAKEDRQFRREMRRKKREELKNASTPEEKKAIRKKYREEKKEMRDADKFEISDTGPSLNDMIDKKTDDKVYTYVAGRIAEIMPDINEIDQNYRGIKLIKTLKSRREKRFTVGQVKRFIKDGLKATEAKDYRLAADKFCAAYVFLETPKTPDKKVVNVSEKTMDVLYELCKEFDGIISGRGKAQKASTRDDKDRDGGKSNKTNQQCVESVQESLNLLNVNNQDVEQLTVDGRWGKKTNEAWFKANKTHLQIGMEFNGVKVTEDIVGKVLRDWPAAGEALKYDRGPCGAMEYLNDLIKMKQDKPKPVPPPNDPDWGKRRSDKKTSGKIDLHKLLTDGGGLSIDYLYTMEEFAAEHDEKIQRADVTYQAKFSDFINLPIAGGANSITGHGSGYVENVQRHPEGPSKNSTFSTALYFNEKTGQMLVDGVGDDIIKDLVLSGNKIYDKNFVPTNESIYKRGKDMILNEKTLRKLIRQKLLKEGMTANETKTLLSTIIGYLNDMAKDNNNIDAENINSRMKAGQAAMEKKNFEEAKKQFAAAAAITDTSLANVESAKKAEIKAVFTALANGVGPNKPAEAKKAKEAVAKLSGKANKGSTKKGSTKKSGNKKVMEIQKQLNILNGKDPELKIDGSWGPNTTKAWEKALNANVAKLEELSKEKFTLADIKKKWSELSKILSATDKKFAGNVDGVADLLATLRGQQSQQDSGKAQKASTKETGNWADLRDKNGRELGQEDLKEFLSDALYAGTFSTSLVYTPEEYGISTTRDLVQNYRTSGRFSPQGVARNLGNETLIFPPGSDFKKPGLDHGTRTTFIYIEKENNLVVDSVGYDYAIGPVYLTADKKNLIFKNPQQAKKS